MKTSKKSFITAMALIGLCMMMITSCGGPKADIPKEYDYADLNEYVKMGNYKGIEYTKVTGEVTDQEIKDYVDGILSDSQETEQINEGTVAEDSIVNIDYVGSVDGVEFVGGTAQGQELDIANSHYIKGFAEGIVGHKVGETFDLHVTFPENYGNEELNGKDAIFKTTINYLVKKKQPTYNDDWVKNNTEYKTVKEYEEYVSGMLRDEKLKSADSNQKSEVFAVILQGSEVLKYPEKELAAKTEQIKKMYMSYAEDSQMSFEDFLSNQMGMTADQFNSMAEESAKQAVLQELVLYSIKNQEGVEIKQSDYEDYLKTTLENAGFTEESFKEQNGKTIAEYANENNMFTSFLYNKVMDKVMEFSVGK